MAPSRIVSVVTPKMANTSTPMLAPATAPAAPRSVPNRCTRRRQTRRRTRCLNNSAAGYSGRPGCCTRTAPGHKVAKAAHCTSKINGYQVPRTDDQSHVDVKQPASPLMAWLADELEHHLELGAKGFQKLNASTVSPAEAWLAKALEEKLLKDTTAVHNESASDVPARVSRQLSDPRLCQTNEFSRKQRVVRFDLRHTTVHEVTPYSEVYGRHPREFVFDGDSKMIPAGFGGFVSLKSLSCRGRVDDEEEDEAEQEYQIEPEWNDESNAILHGRDC